MTMTEVRLVNVFTIDDQGGNPCPVVLAAGGMSALEMQAIARRYGHESGFVMPASVAGHDFDFRFFVPNHEMEMCGHATIGALWLLAREQCLSDETVRIHTLSGTISGHVRDRTSGRPIVEITQPRGETDPLGPEREKAVLAALNITRDDLLDSPIHNARTSRVKTLVPMKDVGRLNSLKTEMPIVEKVCTAIESTGLYPYAILDEDRRIFEARQFPRSSGYPEDAATGIAAAALAFGLLQDGSIVADDRPITIYQGRAMDRLSSITVRIAFDGGKPIDCFLGGEVTLESTVVGGAVAPST